MAEVDPGQNVMTLTLSLPVRTLYEGRVESIVARGLHGSFGILPDHVDMASPLVSGVVVVRREGGAELFFGVDEGVLVKTGAGVRICVHRAYQSEDLRDVRDQVETVFSHVNDQERAARKVLARMEADVARRFSQITRERS